MICDSHDYSLFLLSQLSVVFTYCCSPGPFPVFHEHSLFIANDVLTGCIGSLYALQPALPGSAGLYMYIGFLEISLLTFRLILTGSPPSSY